MHTERSDLGFPNMILPFESVVFYHFGRRTLYGVALWCNRPSEFNVDVAFSSVAKTHYQLEITEKATGWSCLDRFWLINVDQLHQMFAAICKAGRFSLRSI